MVKKHLKPVKDKIYYNIAGNVGYNIKNEILNIIRIKIYDNVFTNTHISENIRFPIFLKIEEQIATLTYNH